MRIVIIDTYYPFPPSVGGVETIVRNTAVELTKRGHEVHIITSNLDVTSQKPVTELGIEEKEGVIIHKLKPSNFRLGYARSLHGLRDVVFELKPDIIHSHNLHPHIFQLTRWRDKIGFKLVAELHYPEIELDFIIQMLAIKPAMHMLKLISKSIDLFIAHTELEKQWLRKYRINPEKIRVVFTPHISRSLTECNVSEKVKDTILFLGRITPRKGVHILMRAFHKIVKLFPKAKLLIAGVEDPVYVRELRKLSLNLGLKDMINFIGYVDDARKMEIMASSTIFCLPSLADYHPIVLLEAQALGTPIISTRVGAIPEIVVNGKTGILVEPDNVNALAEAMLMLLNNEEPYREMMINARKWAKNFTIDKVVTRLETIYGSLQSW